MSKVEIVQGQFRKWIGRIIILLQRINRCQVMQIVGNRKGVRIWIANSLMKDYGFCVRNSIRYIIFERREKRREIVIFCSSLYYL